jgi:hypothetical protein
MCGYPITAGIEFSKDGDELVLKLNKNSLLSNMQSNQSAFEGWSLCLFANADGRYRRIKIEWVPLNKRELTHPELGHYYRFLFRAYKFKENYPAIVEIQPAIESFLDIDEMKLWVLNFPKCEAKESKKDNEGSEALLERELLQKMIGHFDYCDQQLPVGLFLNEVKDAFARSTGKKSQIDLWGVKDNMLNIYELKNDVNEAVGIISELMFYTNVMENFRRHIFNYPSSFDNKRVFYRHSKELHEDIVNNSISAVNGIFLANNLHPRITNRVIDLMNTNIAGIRYSKLSVNDFKASLE